MKILIDDFIQNSNAPETLKSPALADITQFSSLPITLDSVQTFDSIGVGNCDSPTISINGEIITIDPTEENGLYTLNTPQTTDSVLIEFPSSTKIGRIGIGMGRIICASPAREPGFWSTAKPRTTLSGQVIPGVGGVSGRIISVDFRYKFTKEIFEDVQRAYTYQIGQGFPFFISFTDSPLVDRYPWKRLYAFTDLKWIFQSSTAYFLYSKKMKFTEAF